MRTEIKRRKFDNKFVVWVYMVDPTYNPNELEESNIPYISQRWVMVAVEDNIKEARREEDKWRVRIF